MARIRDIVKQLRQADAFLSANGQIVLGRMVEVQYVSDHSIRIVLNNDKTCIQKFKTPIAKQVAEQASKRRRDISYSQFCKACERRGFTVTAEGDSHFVNVDRTPIHANFIGSTWRARLAWLIRYSLDDAIRGLVESAYSGGREDAEGDVSTGLGGSEGRRDAECHSAPAALLG